MGVGGLGQGGVGVGGGQRKRLDWEKIEESSEDRKMTKWNGAAVEARIRDGDWQDDASSDQNLMKPRQEVTFVKYAILFLFKLISFLRKKYQIDVHISKNEFI